MPELSVFFHGRASQQPHYWLGFAKGCVGAWRRWMGALRRSCAVTQAHTAPVLGKCTLSPIYYIFVLISSHLLCFLCLKMVPAQNLAVMLQMYGTLLLPVWK